jgi:hypothetical protein
MITVEPQARPAPTRILISARADVPCRVRIANERMSGWQSRAEGDLDCITGRLVDLESTWTVPAGQ